ncbi:MAG: hypothetical protein LBE91_22060 [Tannerella sp.]|jgi:hypothetical protein|nr:hypothetical protein [Tannerella sp.]
MSAVIVYNNEKRDTLLFEFDSPFIYICGNEGYWDEDFGLAYLLRKNTGFYSWFSIHEKESFMELDTLDRINTIEMWSENNPLLDCIQ